MAFDGRLGWLTDIERPSRVALGGLLTQFLQTDQLQDYLAYPKQAEFHAAGRKYSHRLIRAGNQTGKTHSCGAEVAYHLTGEYPDWWTGKRFDYPIIAWATGETAEATRDNPQRVLLGLPKQLGTGLIPKRCLTQMMGRSRATADAIDFIMIRHISGGLSMLRFRNYSQDRRAWQGPPVQVVWFDEEPREDIYAEGLARTMAVKGITLMSFTPLLGFTTVVKKYIDAEGEPETSDLHTTQMSIFDAGHYSEEERQQRIANTAKHERGARIFGDPLLGSGRIFPYDDELVMCDPFEIPDHWVSLASIDPGTTHPTAAVKGYWDRDNDVVYIVKEYRRSNLTPSEHWLTLRRWGMNLKWAWPKDALQTEKNTGEAVIDRYREEGMKALPEHAQYKASRRKGGGNRGTALSTVSVERGLIDMDERITQGGLQVFKTCPLWFAEFKMYHRKDGKVVKEDDDLMDATRYLVMMLRYFGLEKKKKRVKNRDIDWRLGF